MFGLARKVEDLQEENKKLKRCIDALQRQVDEQGGQLKVLVEFVGIALQRRIDAQVDEAVRCVLERTIQ